ncbi:Nucleic acid-binding OB-fold [Arabidopsis thaliana x Arabidopsis arenosa]|uniref:Nucleic acid-binding OB-fold n=1 Tax=Arabidopsis thaliana x Arabidopsis arenosa TaxID=1240361 RepID=A0A8T1ZMC3_9BRAS|nr:Nucleic acid-binding OB-fold [Arabidopsis thaliana x Arabidopsis arenosa]
MVLADEQGVKIHATVKKDLVTRYAPKLTVGEWKFIEKFGVTPASGHFRPTSHLYKMVFHNDTAVLPSESISESNYLAFVKFKPILARELKTYTLVDVIGQVVNIGELMNLEANNKPTTKLEFELRDDKYMFNTYIQHYRFFKFYMY